MLAGGALFNNLDYSFYAGQESGDGPNDAPGGGSATLRGQLAYLKKFIESIDFIQTLPDASFVHHAPGWETETISQSGRQYLTYLVGMGGPWIKVRLPEGSFDLVFVSPVDKRQLVRSTVTVTGSEKMTRIELPRPSEGKGAIKRLGMRLTRTK